MEEFILVIGTIGVGLTLAWAGMVVFLKWMD